MKRFTAAGLICVLLAFAGLSAQEREAPSREQAADHEPGSGHEAEMQKQMKSMNQMMVKHLGKSDAEYERRFIDMMIPHHQGAVMMAQHALKHAKRPEIKQMAEKMIKDQEKEIAEMKRLREAWYGKSGENAP